MLEVWPEGRLMYHLGAIDSTNVSKAISLLRKDLGAYMKVGMLVGGLLQVHFAGSSYLVQTHLRQ